MCWFDLTVKLSVISFFLDVSPIWLLQEKTTGKDRTCDIYRGYREELALGEVWRGYSTKEGVEGI